MTFAPYTSESVAARAASLLARARAVDHIISYVRTRDMRMHYACCVTISVHNVFPYRDSLVYLRAPYAGPRDSATAKVKSAVVDKLLPTFFDLHS